eukprot:5568221-Amphidinium_carterae.1
MGPSAALRPLLRLLRPRDLLEHHAAPRSAYYTLFSFGCRTNMEVRDSTSAAPPSSGARGVSMPRTLR